ncbi:TPA: GlxA family transcriptional regulator [Pseudomonas aeruginosa]|uniref:GlxA family transcriptional regulator n=1 Tax=Pseudomonas aeruginosa TaxID=287 RepID=UPI000FD364E5|nr:GlxA family transcriptional regulator [Pseudomonas aeruginosa]MCD2823431.1 GlxA family transcriptional regulator [Pseudomonas aeruginosa]MCD2831324.1 GlxA family transcriptional regulator [Pseudomonas aeruginosa]RUI04919.1 GlxA family transcriptional regulator [Pseudomonas aeruginosa]HCE7952627.1 GlxA family transcriptional regulator [Pseudomonas aeruginosa]HCF2831791.1 GlxA family transcriptional regulator [Pseudomonas aeruginosa]
MPEPRLIACLIYPDVMSLDVTGPLQVFASANVERQRQGLPAFYRIQVLGERSEAVPSSAGIRICADLAWRDCPPESLDTLLVPGGLGVEAQTRNADLLAWLKVAEPRIRRLGSVCSGALILAAAGILDGHPATTHWADVATLRQGFPSVHVQGDRLHTYDPQCRDGDAHIFTSAGVTAGIDLALALVEADLGRSLALSVARRLVMFLKRPGGQAQFSAWLTPEPSRTPRLAALLEWIPANLAGDLSLEALADQACMSPRTLSRVFLQELGVAPGRYVERVRLEAARALLQDAQASIATVSRLCGFGHPENLRRTFHKHLSVSPQEYAERFGMLA